MIAAVDPTLSEDEIRVEIARIKPLMEDAANVGEEILSMGTTVKKNKNYNMYNQQLNRLYSMLTQISLRKNRNV